MTAQHNNLGSKLLGVLPILVTGVSIGVLVHFLTREPPPPSPPWVPYGQATGISLTKGNASQASSPSTASDEPVEPHVDEPRDGCGGSPPEHTGALMLYRKDLTQPLLVYVPKNYDPNHRHPVILLFHDAGDPPELLVNDGRFAQIADRHNVVLVAPRGTEVFDGTGLYMRVWETPESRQEIPAIWQHVQDTFCVDPDRVFAVGQAAGGYAVERLMCEMPLAGAATHAHLKLPADPTCQPENSVPYLALWGAHDPFAPEDGSANCIGVSKMSWEESVERWRYYNKTTARDVQTEHDAATCTTYAGNATFGFCTLDGGREWPWARPRIWSKLLSQCESRPATFDAAQLIWKFFTEQTEGAASP